jgi:hypothetical protein
LNPFGDRRFPEPWAQPHQARQTPPTDDENALASSIEAAFAAGVWELSGLVAHLNARGLRTPSGEPWTEARYRDVMARLGR